MTNLQNPARVLESNTDKSYLLQLIQAGLPVVPTDLVEDESELRAAIAMFTGFGTAVLKPRVGASGRGVVVLDGRLPAPGAERLNAGPWVIQPLVDSVRTEGEMSVFLFGGRATSQVRKVPRPGEIRVHEEYGGRSFGVPLDTEAAELAEQSLKVAEELFGLRLPYARADLMRLRDQTMALSELELVEPGLYLDIAPENAVPFVDALVALLGP